jgi:hypothetical protein
MQQNLQRVFCADILVDVAFLFALEAVRHIPAQNVHVAGLGYFVREVLASERTQSRSCHETENGGLAFLILRSLTRSRGPVIVHDLPGAIKSKTFELRSKPLL